jgi:mandelate racemase
MDLQTEEGVVGRSYLERSVRYLVPAIRDLAEARTGRPIVPLDDFWTGRVGLKLIAIEGVSMIAVLGLDMAAWDALAKAAGLPLAVCLGGSLAPVPAHNSYGLWLMPLDALSEQAAALVAEGGFQGLKLRLGRERLADDMTAIQAVRGAVGEAVKLMVDFNQGLSLGDALHGATVLTIRVSTGSKSPLHTTTSRATRSSRASSRHPFSSARISMARGRFSRPSRRGPAITSCRI